MGVERRIRFDVCDCNLYDMYYTTDHLVDRHGPQLEKH
jgi:hypothetical protein